MALTARIQRGNFDRAADNLFRDAHQRTERAILTAVERGTRVAVSSIRGAMQSAGLGRLGSALGTKTDKTIHRTAQGFSASGVIFIRSGSRRSRGAIEAYTGGADIRPTRGRWLWLATDQIPSRAGRQRMTPELYRQSGLEAKIGPLVFVRNISGNPLLVAKNVSVSAAGKSRSAKSLTKTGRLRKGQAAKEFVVAFVGIPRTSRAARIDVPAILQEVAGQLPALYLNSLGRN